MEDAQAVIRDYPAYGRTIATHIVRGIKPVAIGVLLSSVWRYFDQAPKVCIRPDEWRRAHYEFGFLRNLHVVAVPGDDCTEAMLAELLIELMGAGPRLLWAYNVDGSKLYDGAYPHDLIDWVGDLSAKAGARLPRSLIQAAAQPMMVAQRAALERWEIESERVRARGDEAWAKWGMAEYTALDQVRALFASPWRDSSERAA